ncbi:hypothetical protein OAO87_00475 [bacterium]|nr:hypothetical protein [bacterium]
MAARHTDVRSSQAGRRNRAHRARWFHRGPSRAEAPIRRITSATSVEEAARAQHPSHSGVDHVKGRATCCEGFGHYGT